MNGLLLVIVGLLLGPVPYVTYIGLILAIIGVIMVILGRGAFGETHSSFVIGSVLVYSVGYAIVLIAGFAFGASVAQIIATSGSQATLAQSLIDAFNGLLIAVLVGNAVVAVAYVLFTYGLQNSTGRLLLYVGFVLEIVSSVLIAYLVSPLIAEAIAQSFQAGTVDPTPIRNLMSQLQYLQLVRLFPASLFAVSYFGVYNRISKGDLPERPSP